jgi:hypothetical protein
MNNNVLEFYVRMKDLMSSGLAKLAQNTRNTFKEIESSISSSFDKGKQSATGFFNHIKQHLQQLKSNSGGFMQKAGSALGIAGLVLGSIGISSAVQAGGQFIQSSIGTAHNYNMAQAQFANSLQNQGYSHLDTFDAINNAKKLTENVLFTKEQVFDLESQLHLVGNVSENEMQRMGKASEDLATKFHESLGEAGNTLAKAINNPELMRWLGQQLKIAPEVQKQIQDLAKAGKETQARLELLNVVEQKVGGAAEAAFNADPVAKYQSALEDLKVTVGNAFMPYVSTLSDAATKTLEWMNFSKTVPEQLMGEKASIDTLVGSITQLNQGNDLRKQLINELITKYPDFFKNIDAEKATNQQLLDILNDVNKAYRDRINIASSNLLLDTNKKTLADSQSEWVRNNAIVMALKQGDVNTAKALMTPGQSFGYLMSNIGFGASDKGLSQFNIAAYDAKKQMDASQGNINKAITEGLNNTFQQAMDLAQNPAALTSKFGSNKKSLQQFLSLARQIQHYGGRFHTPGGIDFANSLTALMNPAASGGNNNTPPKTPSDVGHDVASGGPRVVNINGVKFADKVEIHGESMQDAYSKTETKLLEMYLRILNSGATIQSN